MTKTRRRSIGLTGPPKRHKNKHLVGRKARMKKTFSMLMISPVEIKLSRVKEITGKSFLLKVLAPYHQQERKCFPSRVLTTTR